MDLRKLKKLIDLVQESGIAELEITEGEEKVKIVKGGAVNMMPAPAAAASAEVRAGTSYSTIVVSIPAAFNASWTRCAEADSDFIIIALRRARDSEVAS